MKYFILTLLLSMALSGSAQRKPKVDVLRDSIILSDPCILADEGTQTYYMTGTGGLLWKSKDLEKWTGPYRVAQTDTASWMGKHLDVQVTFW